MNRPGELFVYRGCTPVVDAKYEPDMGRTPSEAVIWALADAVGVDPVELPPLYDYVDTEALNELFERRDRTTGGDTILSFQVNTWNVFVCSDGRIRVCDGTQPTDPEPVFEPPTA